jgi:hypothetical protein
VTPTPPRIGGRRTRPSSRTGVPGHTVVCSGPGCQARCASTTPTILPAWPARSVLLRSPGINDHKPGPDTACTLLDGISVAVRDGRRLGRFAGKKPARHSSPTDASFIFAEMQIMSHPRSEPAFTTPAIRRISRMRYMLIHLHLTSSAGTTSARTKTISAQDTLLASIPLP